MVNFVLLKFIQCSLLRSREELLNFLVPVWRPHHRAFDVRGQMVEMSTETSTYFLTRLSIRGEVPEVIPRMDGGITVQTLVDRYCDGQDVITRGSIRVAHI
jgi:hypothetical protein